MASTKTVDKITDLGQKREHIFPATLITQLATRWKEHVAKGQHKQAMVLLEEIVIQSTPMFQRLAQYEDFHRTVDLPILISAAQEKIVKWLEKWNPQKGKIFSWFSKCAKNAFRTEVVRVVHHRRKIHTTGEDLERFHGTEDHAVNTLDAERVFQTKIRDITARWGDPQELGALRYLIGAIVSDGHVKQKAIRGAAYAYGLSFDHAKFFYTWSLTALRGALHESTRVPLTDQDLFISFYSRTLLPDLLNIITWDQMKKMIVIFGGQRLKIPTLTEMASIRADYTAHCEIAASGLDPDSVEEVAKKLKRSPRSAQEAYETMVEQLDSRRSGEHYVFEGYHEDE